MASLKALLTDRVPEARRIKVETVEQHGVPGTMVNMTFPIHPGIERTDQWFFADGNKMTAEHKLSVILSYLTD